MTDTIDSNTNTHLSSSLLALPNVASRQQGAAQFASVAVAITAPPARILRLPEVMARVGLKRASIYQRMADGSFPKQISLGIRAVGWLESEIDEWLMSRINARYFMKS